MNIAEECLKKMKLGVDITPSVEDTRRTTFFAPNGKHCTAAHIAKEYGCTKGYVSYLYSEFGVQMAHDKLRAMKERK